MANINLANINPRTTPIALALAGAIIISAALSAYAFGQHVDSFLTAIVVAVILVGAFSILLSAYLYYWERDRYFEILPRLK